MLRVLKHTRFPETFAAFFAVSLHQGSSKATGGDPLHGPVSLPHIPVRTDDTPRKAVYLIVQYWDGKCASAPSRAISEWKPRPLVPPTLAGAFHVDSFFVEGFVSNHWWWRLATGNVVAESGPESRLGGLIRYARRLCSTPIG